MKNRNSTFQFALTVFMINLISLLTYFCGPRALVEEMSTMLSMIDLLQIDRVRHSYPATCPVKIFVI